MLHPSLDIQFSDQGCFSLRHRDTTLPVAEGKILLEIPEACWSGFEMTTPSTDERTAEPFLHGFDWIQSAIYYLELPGDGKVTLTIQVFRVERWSEALFLAVRLENNSPAPLRIGRMATPELHLGAALPGPLWTFQGAAVRWGMDFAFPLPESFHRDNFLGHIQNGEGGAIPLVCCWNRERGLALAHIEPQPKDGYLPVTSDPDQGVRMAFENRQPTILHPGVSLRLPRMMISTFHGDFFDPLALYRECLAVQGVLHAEPNAEDFEPAWCSWGYEFDVRPEEVLGILPQLRRLGIHWVTLDDRWFDRYGDWGPRGDTFPRGENQMRQMVDAIHHEGAYAQIWWYPLCVEDGIGRYDSHVYGVSQVLREHPDWLILNPDGAPARNNRGLAILDPSLDDVQEYLEGLTLRFIQDWGFDGHKLDNIYTVPPCYNPAHRHRHPEESVEAYSQAYGRIFETTRRLKPYSVTQICPCGTPPTFSLLPYMDQAVTADPTSSAQIRQRIKFYKALLGPHAAVFADHVELSDGGVDFASEIGAGGVPGTKFTWPEDSTLRARLKESWELTPEKETLYRKWLGVYTQHPLAKGETLNLYDLGFDSPETYAIRFGNRHYFALFTSRTNEWFDGPIELRGLQPGVGYQITDYVHQKAIGEGMGPTATFQVRFQGSLLLLAEPKG